MSRAQPAAAAGARGEPVDRRDPGQDRGHDADARGVADLASGERRRVRDHGWCRPVVRTRDVGVPKELRRMSEEPKLEELDRLISMGKQKGFLTYDEVNDALPSDLVSLDQLDDIMMMFGAMDIEVVDSAKAGRLPSEVRERKAVEPDDNDDDGPPEPIDLTPGPVGRTEDPVRLYLREMGRVALLTREGEIALAKRIEEGKNQVTSAILSTNLALERFRELREQLRRHDISVKEVVDVNEEEFTEEKETELTRQVTAAFATVDRLLRERDKLVVHARKLRLKTPGRRRSRKGKEPAWKRLEAQAQQRQTRVLEKLRALNIGNQIIDREDADLGRRGLVQRLRDLLDDIERAERVIRLWTNGRRPSADEVQNLIYVSFRDPGTNGVSGGTGDLHLKAAKKFPSPKQQQVWVAQQEIKVAATRANAKADQARTISIPWHMTNTINKLIRTSRQPVQELGREPTPEEIAANMDVPVDKVRKVLKIAQEPISLETPIGEEEDSHLGDFIEDKQVVSPVDSIIGLSLREQTNKVLNTLTPREEKVLRLRFGLSDGCEHTLEEVGQDFAVTRERIRQIEAKALRKLRHPSRSKKLRSFLES